MRGTRPCTPSDASENAGLSNSPCTSVIGTFNTEVSTTRATSTPNRSPNDQPVSSYGCFCGSSGDQYWRSSKVSAMREYGWSMRMIQLPAGKVRLTVATFGGSVDVDFLALGLSPSVLSVSSATSTVNGALARLISTCCRCSARNRCICAPLSFSLAVSTYAAGPASCGFSIERLDFSQKLSRKC